MDDFVTVSVEEYSKLKEDGLFLDALNASGVDNWDGYEEAIDMFHSMLETS